MNIACHIKPRIIGLTLALVVSAWLPVFAQDIAESSPSSELETVIVEIHNTPWGEVFSYVLDEGENTGTISEKSFSFSKAFHISPFMDMDMHYNWKFTEPGESLNVHMVSLEKEKEFFHAELTLERREITGKNLARVLLQYPLMTVKVIAAIYWQALRLRIKGVPFYTHPEKRNQETSAL